MSGVLRLLRSWFTLRQEPIQDEWTRAARPALIPEAVVAEFTRDHPHMGISQVPIVVAAFLQWVRIEGRQPGGHAISSRVVLDFYSLLQGEELIWRRFCRALPLDGRDLTPPRAWDVWNPVDRCDSAALGVTWSSAMRDEYPADWLPALFSVDEVCGIPGSARIRATCIDSPCTTRPPDFCLHIDFSVGPIGGWSGG